MDINKIKRLEKQIAECNSKLSNISFINKAPAHVILNEENKKKDFTAQLDMLKNQSNETEYNEICEWMVHDTKCWIIIPKINKK